MLGRLALAIAIACIGLILVWAQPRGILDDKELPPVASVQEPRLELDDEKLQEEMASKVEQAVIHPHQSANVGAEVSGILDAISFEEGDPVERNAVVAKIRKDRETIARQKTFEKLHGLKLELENAEIEVNIRQNLLSLGGGTRLELEKARTTVEIKRRKIGEAEEELKAAELNLQACEIRAPFSGHIAVRYKQPYESVERLEKVFALVDSSTVLAVANVPEHVLRKFPKNSQAIFVHSSGKKYKGKVDRLSKLIDPKSMTKRVYVLIDNRDGELEIGTTGTLESAD